MMNKSTTVAVLGAILAVAALAAALPTMIHTAYAASATTGAFATNDFAAATGAGSTSVSGSSAGFIAACPNFAAAGGSCSEALP
jgi:uncharacterized membrane protein